MDLRIELDSSEPQREIFFPDVPARHTIVPKGRRFGATHGAANACVVWAASGMPVLWGDTVHGNIIRYVDRYFLPAIRANNIFHEWRKDVKILRIGAGFIDFRSADRPENWEGFGYRKIVLNEAGIILANPYLYTNAVRPMMLDYSESELYALGVPKGKKLKTGAEHPFYSLWTRVGTEGYRGKCYSSFDNPWIREEDVRELELDMTKMDKDQIAQEIYGQFIDRVAGNPFAFNFDRAKHVRPCKLDPRLPVIISLDFNLDPFTAVIMQEQGKRLAVCAEVGIEGGTIGELVERIRAVTPHIFLHKYTGDRTGRARRIQMKSTASLWDDFMAAMGARESQLELPANPSHKDSREQVNYLFYHHPELVIDPNCTGLIFDLDSVEVGQDLSIVKHDRTHAAQKADYLDGFRYAVNTYLRQWIDLHRRTHAMRRDPKSL